MACSNWLKGQNMAYPRTCEDCKLGPCLHTDFMNKKQPSLPEVESFGRIENVSLRTKAVTETGKEQVRIIEDKLSASGVVVTGEYVGVKTEPEYTGLKTSYYNIAVKTIDGRTVVIDADAVIMSLKCNFFQGNVIKAVWRVCCAMNLGQWKKGYTDGVYDSEKVVHYGSKMVEFEKAKKNVE